MGGVEKMELDSSQRCAPRTIGSRDKLQRGKYQLHIKKKHNHEHGSDVRWWPRGILQSASFKILKTRVDEALSNLLWL